MKQSVVIPLRNGAQFIEQTLDSIAKAPLVDDIVIVDDGSEDEGPAIATRWAERHGRPVLLTDVTSPEGPSGPSAARNRGAQVASSEWLWFVDGDDLTTITDVDPRRNPPPGTDVVFARLQRFALWPDGERRSEPERFPHVSTLLVRRAYFLAMGSFNEQLRYGEDLDFYQRLLEQRAAIHEIDDVTMLFRQHAGSYTGQRPEALRSGLFAALRAAALRARTESPSENS
jgi:glycosyltransferase involved in cell wall biosynthesis